MPALPRLVTNKLVDYSQALAVMTRAQKKTRDDLEASDEQEDVRDKSPATSDCDFFRKRSILYRRWFPRWRIKPMEMLTPCQELILRQTILPSFTLEKGGGM